MHIPDVTGWIGMDTAAVFIPNPLAQLAAELLSRSVVLQESRVRFEAGTDASGLVPSN